ncbi:peptidyl-prolyl cis-trans isomerase D [mine drainage metagenome]|uniref:Periplasmic chaperone PpiD n=1 Tax=mine drainage metagenome TaxID=410659 RepID=A0A1J5QYE6_9ZZZZ
MLETFREHSKGWLAKLILALITVPFALWGIDSYLQGAGSNVAVAKVDGNGITMQEYGNAMQEMRSKLQASGKTDPALLEDPAVKESVLNQLIVKRLLNTEVRRANFTISDDQLGKFILTLPEFQQNGKFSQELYDSILAQNHLTPSQFEARMRSSLLSQSARDSIAATAYLPNRLLDNILRTEYQQREVSVADIKADDFMSQAKVDAAQVKAFYDKNQDKFRVPEQVKVEFVMLSVNNLIPSMQVSEDEVKKYYAENADKFKGDEQRRASHILFSFGGKTDAASKKAVHEKALMVLAEVRKNPKQFAELAKKYSQDPGSAEKGGDLGVFGRGMMVKPFEDTVFAMAPGAISDLVETEFGYHIIQLTEIKGQGKTYDEVKAGIRGDLMYQKALAKFAEQAETFSNMVYEQSDSLQPVVKAFGISTQTSAWMSRADAMKFFKNEKLVNAIFSTEVLKDKRNTEAIEAAPNTLVSARVLEYKPAAARSFAEVSPALETYLKHEQAMLLAGKKSSELLAELRQGKAVADLNWIPSVVIDRKNAQGLSDEVMRKVFTIDAAKTPAFDLVEKKNVGYSLIRVSHVDSAVPTDEAEKKSLQGEVQAALADEYVAAYLAGLKARGNISVNMQVLNSSPQ